MILYVRVSYTSWSIYLFYFSRTVLFRHDRKVWDLSPRGAESVSGYLSPEISSGVH